MAEHLMDKFKHLLSIIQKSIPLLFLLSVLTLPAGVAQADILKDPTQPPPAFLSNMQGMELTSGEPALQSVMIGANYQAAIINGQKIMLGKKYGQATLIKLNDREAVLRHPDRTTQTLKMNYAIKKNLATQQSPVSRNNSNTQNTAKQE